MAKVSCLEQLFVDIFCVFFDAFASDRDVLLLFLLPEPALSLLLLFLLEKEALFLFRI